MSTVTTTAPLVRLKVKKAFLVSIILPLVL